MDLESRLNIRIDDLENLSKRYNFSLPFLQKASKRNVLIIPKYYVALLCTTLSSLHVFLRTIVI